MRFQSRKPIHLQPQDQYFGRRIYFLAVRCEMRRRVFANSSHGTALVHDLKSVSQKVNFLVHAYCNARPSPYSCGGTLSI